MESLNDTVSSHMTSPDRSPMEVSYGQISSTEEDSGDDVSGTDEPMEEHKDTNKRKL